MTMPQPTRAVFFDLDGTLADSLDVLRQVYGYFMEAHGLKADAGEFDSLNGVPLTEAVAMLSRRHGIERPAEELYAAYIGKVEEAYLGVEPFEEARDLLERLARSDWYVGLVTSNGRKRTEAWLDRHGLMDRFATLVCAEDVARGKPDPEPYLTALARSGLAAEQAWAVEDAALGVQAALAADLRVVHVLEGSTMAHANDDPARLVRVDRLGEVRAVLDAHAD